MSKLPNAPLLEVVFEIKWDIINKNDIIDFQYIHGDLYSKLKGKFPFRENLLPPEVPFEVVKGMPVYRFRKDRNEYPLVQVGPGLLTLNTNDDKYFWEEFKEEINDTLNALKDIYPKLIDFKLNPTLTYIDFFEISFEKQNLLEFINENLNLNIQQGFIELTDESLKDINLTFNYQIKNDILSFNLRNGMINNKKIGLILQTKVIGGNNMYSSETLTEWLNESHEICSEAFKKISKGKLYESFK